MRTGTTARSIAVTGAALLAISACGGGSEDEGGDTGADSGEKQVNIYGTDGNMGNALGEDFSEEGSLAGMRGTTPLTDLSSDFVDRLKEVDPELQDLNYAGETYDAIVLAALAAQAAGTNQATAFAPYVNGLTFGGEACTDFAACAEILAGGGNVDYDGASGPLSFAEAGEPAEASFGILQFGDDNALDDDATEFVLAGDEANAATDEGPDPVPTATGGAPLVVGTLLPLTGNLAFLGPPEVAGAKLAIQDINEAGGVFGQPVQLVEGDSGDASTDTATQTVDRLLQSGVNVIVGAASSGVSLTVIDAITQAGVMQISPANTSDQFTTYNDNGLYFRTAPPDTLQARALADLIIEDGNNTVGILALNDPYGTGLAENTLQNLVDAGLSEDDIQSITYDPQAANFDSEVQQMVDFNPDAIVVIGFEESSRILEGLNSNGVGPQR
ncbi:ABC transporter substrate-binding protein [Blastococcus haudaquaticus]|uniref:Amino acid/amide ABC transporter substrate-binding protein, HAAT family n=1 Tax=Blastococcus haudaquaticus TaxID=1938745 RepID=A0A286H4H1_9ACTN|nr:ABC transporter substrate-binding protein [Blastococcus haudaquaticus]SOE02685.1 amino acid/amide ABC transporter substrate-binding protein, HAAT family [Blastococcus haudaquaticus]